MNNWATSCIRETETTNILGDLRRNDNDGYMVKNLITQSCLKELTINNDFIILRTTMIIEKTYFNIEKLADLDPLSENMLEIVNDLVS